MILIHRIGFVSNNIVINPRFLFTIFGLKIFYCILLFQRKKYYIFFSWRFCFRFLNYINNSINNFLWRSYIKLRIFPQIEVIHNKVHVYIVLFKIFIFNYHGNPLQYKFSLELQFLYWWQIFRRFRKYQIYYLNINN